LSIILGYAGLLESRLTDPEARRFAVAIGRAANRSGDLTLNLLAFSRQSRFESVALDLHELIGEVVELLGHSLDKRINIAQDLRAPRAVAMGDPSTLQNALLNLAFNARDAMPHGGTLTFATEALDDGPQASQPPAVRHELESLPPGAFLRIGVTDTGTGIGDEVKKHLFEPFFTTKPIGKGTGMGLASVFGTIKTHEGRIAVETALGKGTTFHLILPAARMAPLSVAKETVPETTGKALRVLVVDDDGTVREIIRDMLRASGHTVLEASGGRRALEIYGEKWREIDLVILDLIMPDMEGQETFAGLRRIWAEVRVLISTGFPGDAKIQPLLDAGAKGLLRKPYEKVMLDKMIAAALA
jgi:CheY-like chemotaxis protein